MDQPLMLNFRFAVSFLTWGAMRSTVDTRFQKVSGLSADVGTTTVEEGGQNLYIQTLPQRVKYGNLVLERGRVVGSTITMRFDDALSRFSFKPTDVLITLFDDNRVIASAWLVQRAYPVKWSTAGLDAASPAVLIDTMELAFTRIQLLSL